MKNLESCCVIVSLCMIFPFNSMECVGIKSLLHYLRANINLVRRNTSKFDFLKLYKREKDKTKSMLEKTLGRISLNSDCCSSLTIFSYICLTTHFIEIIHTLLTKWGVNMKTVTYFKQCFFKWCLYWVVKKSIVYKRGLVKLGEYLHLRCCAHIVNLVV